MTLIELRNMCVKMLQKQIDFYGVNRYKMLENQKSVDGIPSSAIEAVIEGILSIDLPDQDTSVAELEKQVEELNTRLNQNVSLLVNETLQSENEILLKKVVELKESLRYLIEKAENSFGTIKTKKFEIAKEQAKC